MLDNGEKVDILLLKNLDPAVTIYYESIKGVITEIGGQLAHAAIVARELKTPCVTGIKNITEVVKDGDIALNILESGS